MHLLVCFLRHHTAWPRYICQLLRLDLFEGLWDGDIAPTGDLCTTRQDVLLLVVQTHGHLLGDTLEATELIGLGASMAECLHALLRLHHVAQDPTQ